MHHRKDDQDGQHGGLRAGGERLQGCHKVLTHTQPRRDPHLHGGAAAAAQRHGAALVIDRNARSVWKDAQRRNYTVTGKGASSSCRPGRAVAAAAGSRAQRPIS